MRLPSWTKFLALFLFASFAWVSLSENFVHHHIQETDDCAYCQFHKTVSNSDFSAAPLHLIPLFLVVTAVLRTTLMPSRIILVEYPGRAPPQNLL